VLARVTQAGCGDSVLGDAPKPAGCGPGQLSGWPCVGAGGVGPGGGLQGSLPASAMLWSCDQCSGSSRFEALLHVLGSAYGKNSWFIVRTSPAGN